MIVTIERIEPIEEAFARLRASPLEASGTEKIFIYKDARMRLADFYPDEINPSSLYVLKERLLNLRLLHHELLKHGVDIFSQSHVYYLNIQRETKEGKTVWEKTSIAPPVVEFFTETASIIPKDTDREPPSFIPVTIPFLYDGIHRAYLAREARIMLRVVLISGALREHLPYAYPNSWAEVRVCDTIPPVKKFYRRVNPYTFMRPLSVLRGSGIEWGRT